MQNLTFSLSCYATTSHKQLSCLGKNFPIKNYDCKWTVACVTDRSRGWCCYTTDGQTFPHCLCHGNFVNNDLAIGGERISVIQFVLLCTFFELWHLLLMHCVLFFLSLCNQSYCWTVISANGIILSSVHLSVMLYIVVLRVDVGDWKLYHHVPIHFFRYFCCRIYRSATTPCKKPNCQNFRIWNSHGQYYHVTVAIQESTLRLSAVRFCSYTLHRNIYIIGIFSDSYASCLHLPSLNKTWMDFLLYRTQCWCAYYRQ